MSGIDRLTDERHADTERNRILNIALTDLDAIINGHNPDVDTSINNMVWDRLDKLACDVELLAHRRASQAAPAPSDAANSALNEAREKIAARRNACPPGPLFRAFNEAMGDIEDVRFALSASPAQEGGE